jgi:Tfp pilus assembly protein PilV
MARLKLIAKQKIPASSLPEVVVSMVIIVVVLALAMSIFAQVSRTSLSVRKVKAQAILNEIALNTIRAEERPQNTTFTAGGFRIVQERTAGDESGTIILRLTAFDRQDSVANLQQIITDTYAQP